MNMARSLAITRRVFRGFRHDPRSIGLMLIAPILAMSVFGIAFGGDVSNVDVVIVNDDEGFQPHPTLPELRISDAFIDNLDKDVLNIERMDSLEDAVDLVEDGEKWAVIHFPTDYSRAIASGNTTTITVRADQSNAQVFSAILVEMREAAEATLDDVNMSLPVEVDYSDAVYGKGAEFSDFLIPGVIGFAIFLLTTLLTLLTFTSERVNNTLERLQVTPITSFEIVMGYAIAFGVIGSLQAIVLVTYGVVVFDIFVEGSLLLAIFITAILAIASMAFGILLSAAARTELQAIQMIPLIVLPVFLLSGIFWPIEAMPTFLRPFSYALPPTYAVEGLRSIMIRGWGVAEVWPQIVCILVFVVLYLVLATLSLRRKD